jgi:hypothetical protein
MHLTKKERALQKVRMTPLQRISINRPLRRSASVPRSDLYPEIDQTAKGELHGKCNVTACAERGEDVKWWNRPMRAHYCSYCKREISRFDDYLGTDQAIFETSPREKLSGHEITSIIIDEA